TLKKVSFLLLRFLWTSKENEEVPKHRFAPKVSEQILTLNNTSTNTQPSYCFGINAKKSPPNFPLNQAFE
ncbi:MAG: hypothetical protein KDD49_07840, partial [Bacteroidetes bacterium]|nr:hypothetical protein [Bacteroidota bacterium]